MRNKKNLLVTLFIALFLVFSSCAPRGIKKYRSYKPPKSERKNALPCGSCKKKKKKKISMLETSVSMYGYTDKLIRG